MVVVIITGFFIFIVIIIINGIFIVIAIFIVINRLYFICLRASQCSSIEQAYSLQSISC